jgi:hypothetical protein
MDFFGKMLGGDFSGKGIRYIDPIDLRSEYNLRNKNADVGSKTETNFFINSYPMIF